MTTLPASYATVGDVMSRYPPIGSTSAITSLQIQNAIGAVQAKIDILLGQRYAIPFAQVPPIIATIAGDLACLRIIETRILSNWQAEADKGGQAKAWTEQLRSSGKLLELLASGAYGLPSGSGTLLPQTTMTQGEVWLSPVCSPTFHGQRWVDVPLDSCCEPGGRWWWP